MRVAINGFGRIGRNFLRAVYADPGALALIDVVAINLGDAKKELSAHLFTHDTILGKFDGSATVKAEYLEVNGKLIRLLNQMQPENNVWSEFGIDWVVDCSGAFTDRSQALLHITHGAKKVLVSAPALGEDVTIIPGVNDAAFDAKKHVIVSLGSCTSNALFPLLKICRDAFNFSYAWAMTVHAYTNSQVLIDVAGKDARLSRAAALNIIPAGSGAQKSLGSVLPELKDKVQLSAVRVPVADVSFLEFIFQTSSTLSVANINEVFERAARGVFKGIVATSNEPLVSSDYQGNDNSVIVDTLLTTAMGNSGRICGWYDNEWGYSVRLKDFLKLVS